MVRDAPGTQATTVVVGGGMVGMSIARSLIGAGERVTVIERDAPGSGCSFGNAGAISSGSVAPLAMPGLVTKIPGYLLDPLSPLYIRWRYLPQAAPWLWKFVRASAPDRVEAISLALHELLQRSIPAYRRLIARNAADDLISFTGQLHLYPDSAQRRADEPIWALRRSRGIVFEDVDAGGIRDLEPEVGPSYTAGVFLPNDGMVRNPHRLVERLAENFQRSGGKIVRGEVVAVDFEDGEPRVLRTREDAIRADRIVVAAGAWSGRLASLLGSRVPLQTQRGYHVTHPDADVRLTRPVVGADVKCFVTPMDVGLRAAGTVEIDSLEAAPNFERARTLNSYARKLLPGLRIGHFTEWMGNRPCLPDSLPVIGRSPRFRSVHFAFGHGHLGLTEAPITAEIVTALIRGEEPPFDISPFRIDRFA